MGRITRLYAAIRVGFHEVMAQSPSAFSTQHSAPSNQRAFQRVPWASKGWMLIA